ncbi:MAG: hypothetical protein ABI053_08695 [Lacisediminihabitans sp.]
MIRLNDWERQLRDGQVVSLPGEAQEYEVIIRRKKLENQKLSNEPDENGRSSDARPKTGIQVHEQHVSDEHDNGTAVTIFLSHSSVDRMLASIPTGNDLDERVGPFYDAAGLASWKQVSRQAIHRQMQKRRILGLRTSDREIIYPAWQFNTQGTALPLMKDVLDALDPEGRDPWGDALWLRTPSKRWGGRSPAELLRAGKADQVLEVAQGIGRALAS